MAHFGPLGGANASQAQLSG